MDDGVAAVALGAGMLAALNPCGFALLPAYLTMLVAGDAPGRAVAVRRALVLTVAMTGGFVTVFAVFGLVVSPLAAGVQRYLPWLTVVIGLALVASGAWLLAGRSLVGVGRLRVGGRAPITRSARSMFGFGISYAAASLSCTIAPFLAVVVSSFRSGSLAEGALLFVLYAAGMGLVVGTAAVAVALAQGTLVARMRRLGRVIPRISGALLVVVGAYVAYYGWWEVRVLGGGDPDDPVIDAAATIQQTVATWVDRVGAPGFVATLAVLLVVVALLSRRRRRGRASTQVSGPEAG